MNTLVALLLALASFGYGTPNFDGWPPARYVRDTGTAYVHFESPDAVEKKCGDPSDAANGLVTEACSFGHPNELYLPNPCGFPKSDDFARLTCHELGHLNGWPDNHPR